jgi:membrane protein required for colicin V production
LQIKYSQCAAVLNARCPQDIDDNRHNRSFAKIESIDYMPIDIIFLAVFGYGFWQGYSRGIIGTVFNILAYLFGITLAFKVTPTTTSILESMFHSKNPAMFIAAFVVNLTLIMLVLRMAAKSAENVLQALYIGVINQILGGLFMSAVSVLLYSVLVWFAVKVQFLNSTTVSESRSYEFLSTLPPKAKVIALRLKPFAEEMWSTSLSWMDRLEQYGEKKVGVEQPNIYKPEGKSIETDPLEEPSAVPTRRVKPADEPIIED